jgi:hypothetical protein
MGVTILPSTLDGGLTPICGGCGIKENWDISQEEYNKCPNFWDRWKCKECREINVASPKEEKCHKPNMH